MTSVELTTWQDPETGEVFAAVLLDGELLLLDPITPADSACANPFVQGGPEGAQGGIGGSDDDAPCTNENGPEPHK